MNVFMYLLLGFLLICAVAVSFSKNLLNSILIFMSYSLIMSIIWMLLEAPDLAVTEAAVGAGVTSILFFVTLKKIHAIQSQNQLEQIQNEQEVKRNQTEEENGPELEKNQSDKALTDKNREINKSSKKENADEKEE